jgi:predicted GNAT family N-acyltransferase
MRNGRPSDITDPPGGADDPSVGFTFKVALPAEVPAAVALGKLVYERDLHRAPEEALDEEAHHLIVLNAASDVIAAVRILGPDQRPFELEEYTDLRSFLGPRRTPAVIGRLCIDPSHRSPRTSVSILMGILKLSLMFARKQSITDYFLYTYPNLVPFYRKAFFKTLNVTLNHPYWGCVELMRLDLVTLRHRLASFPKLAEFLALRDSDHFLV